MKNILSIDDSEINLHLIEAIFSDEPDIQVTLIYDSRQALDKMKKIQPDLVLLDLMMPHKHLIKGLLKTYAKNYSFRKYQFFI